MALLKFSKPTLTPSTTFFYSMSTAPYKYHNETGEVSSHPALSAILSASLVILLVDLRFFTTMARALTWPTTLTSFFPLVTA